MLPAFDSPPYGITRALPGVPFSEALTRTRAALAAEGFGVLTEIDMKATLAAKLGAEILPYVIFGACNPPLALEALSREPGAGLLLPCNVVVTDDGAGGSVVSAVDVDVLFKVVERPDVAPIAAKVREKLARAMRALG